MSDREQRVIYKLGGLKRETYPREIGYFDCETRYEEGVGHQVHRLRSGVFILQRYHMGLPQGERQVHDFHTASEFWALVEKRALPGRLLWLVAHNLDFDFAAVEGFKYLADHGWEVKFFAISASNFLLRVSRGKQRIQFLDSLGFFRSSLRQLGARVGLEKGQLPSQDAPESVWQSYCFRDVEILQLAVEEYMRFVKANHLGSLALTTPGQAVKAYRTRFMTAPLTVHRIPRIMLLERSSYHGGRTEAFYLGKVPASPVWYLDVNSMYPHIMKTNTFPCQLLGVWNSPTNVRTYQLLQKREVLARCRVETPEPCIPVAGERVTFPIGTMDTVLAGPEFRYCWEHGYVKKIYQIVTYRRGNPFEEYIDYFWKLRCAAKEREDRVYDYFCKLMMNSLYGKFAQINPVYEEFDAVPGEADGLTALIHGSDGRKESRLTFAGKTWVKVGERPAYHSFFPLASWVTSAARAYLWELIKQAGRENVYYCDTDSLFVNEMGYRRLQGLISEGVLGALGVKKQGKTLVIHGCKDYVFDDEVRIKGVPKTAVEVKQGVFTYTTFMKGRSRLQRGLENSVVQMEVTKHLSRRYTKGVRAPDGTVFPHRLSVE